jgi:hypothetical protein
MTGVTTSSAAIDFDVSNPNNPGDLSIAKAKGTTEESNQDAQQAHCNPIIIDQFIALYQKLNKDNLHLLSDVYAENITFRDPLHQVQGLASLTEYFANLYSNISFIEFDISEVFHNQSQQQVSLFWTMRYAHPKLNKGQAIHVDGMSKLQYKDKIYYHRDYFDVGQMLYEKVPFLGGLIKMLKKRIG